MDNDLISRSALKMLIEQFQIINPKLSVYDVLNIIDNAPTVTPISNDKWIPIKTRPLTEEEKDEYPDWEFIYDCQLPDDGQEVLITTNCGYVVLDTFYRDDGCYFECYCDEGDVVAWQPLPKPYKGADNE